MNNLKRLGIFLLIFAVIIVVSVSYKGNDILKRAIVLGIGVDVADDGKLAVTAEIVSPGNGTESVGMFSKTVTDKGETVAEALQNIAEKAGKETSLGQCVLLIYGEDYVKQDFTSTADYFARSDSFKESAMVCCCEGKAEDVLNKSDAVSQSVSLSLSNKLKGVSKNVAIPACDLLTFSRSQRELYKTGFLSYVRFEQSENTDDAKSGQKQGFFVCDNVAVFRQNKMIGILSEEETKGFAILADRVTGNIFSVESEKDTLLTIRTNTKKVDMKQKDGTVTMSIEMHVKLARTDSFGSGGEFAAQTQAEMSKDLLNQVKTQSERLAKLFLQKQIDWEFDLVNIHEIFRQKYGTTKAVTNMKMSDVPIELHFDVQEK